MNRKKLFGVSKFWAVTLNVYISLSVHNFFEILGPFPEKCMFFSLKVIHHCKPSSFYLPDMKKYYGTYQILKKFTWECPCLFIVISLSLSLFIMNNSFIGNTNFISKWSMYSKLHNCWATVKVCFSLNELTYWSKKT